MIRGSMGFKLMSLSVWLLSAASSAVEVPQGLLERLGPDSRVLGVYRVRDIRKHSRSHKGTICKPYQDRLGDWEDPDRDCGKTLVMVQSPQSIAMFELGGDRYEESVLRNFLMTEANFSPHCDGSISLSGDAVSAIDRGKLCRALRAKKRETRKAMSYVYFDDMDPNGKALENALTNFGVFGLPAGVSFSFEIKIPKKDPAPEELKLTKWVEGSVLFVSSQWKLTYTLERVAVDTPPADLTPVAAVGRVHSPYDILN